MGVLACASIWDNPLILNTDAVRTPGIPHAGDLIPSLPYSMDKNPTLKASLEPLHGRKPT